MCDEMLIRKYNIATQEHLDAQKEFQITLVKYFHELSQLIGNGNGDAISAEKATAEVVEPIEF